MKLEQNFDLAVENCLSTHPITGGLMKQKAVAQQSL